MSFWEVGIAQMIKEFITQSLEVHFIFTRAKKLFQSSVRWTSYIFVLPNHLHPKQSCLFWLFYYIFVCISYPSYPCYTFQPIYSSLIWWTLIIFHEYYKLRTHHAFPSTVTFPSRIQVSNSLLYLHLLWWFQNVHPCPNTPCDICLHTRA
jgi:hypothetical protein